jgi:hypothetical protein
MLTYCDAAGYIHLKFPAENSVAQGAMRFRLVSGVSLERVRGYAHIRVNSKFGSDSAGAENERIFRSQREYASPGL